MQKLIEANDTDVIVLGQRAYALRIHLEALRITYGVGDEIGYIAIHDVVSSIGGCRAMAMPGCHAFSGCDTTSTIYGKRKRTSYLTSEKILNTEPNLFNHLTN